VELLDPGDVLADVVLGPQRPELLALGRELADEVRQTPVVGVVTAEARSTATVSCAALFQSMYRSWACGSRKM
jgi:hypothetical protein